MIQGVGCRVWGPGSGVQDYALSVQLVSSLVERLRVVQGLRVVPVFLYRYSMKDQSEKGSQSRDYGGGDIRRGTRVKCSVTSIRVQGLRFKFWVQGLNLGCRVQSLGLIGVQGKGLRVQVQGLGLRVQGLWFMVYGLWFRVQGGLRVQGLGFMVSGFGFRVQSLGFRVQDLGFRVQRLNLGFRVKGIGFRVQGLGFRILDLGFRIQGFRFKV